MHVVFVLQCVAVCCSVLQCVAVCCSDTSGGQTTVRSKPHLYMLCLYYSVLQCVTVCYSVLQ